MKTKLPWILVAVLAGALIFSSLSHRERVPLSEAKGRVRGAQAAQTPKRILYYVDPMHPQYKSDKPGKAPDCGMDLVPVYADGANNNALTISTQRQQLIGVATGVVGRGSIVMALPTARPG